jgi:hypothetical protein
MAGDLKRRVERLSKGRRNQDGGAYGVPPEVVRQRFEQGMIDTVKRAVQLREARARGDELSDPFERGHPRSEKIAHFISYGDVDAVPKKLFEDVVGRIEQTREEPLRVLSALVLEREMEMFSEMIGESNVE